MPRMVVSGITAPRFKASRASSCSEWLLEWLSLLLETLLFELEEDEELEEDDLEEEDLEDEEFDEELDEEEDDGTISQNGHTPGR